MEKVMARKNKYSSEQDVFLNVPSGVYPAKITWVPGEKGPSGRVRSDYGVAFTDYRGRFYDEGYFESYVFATEYDARIHNIRMAIVGIDCEHDELLEKIKEYDSPTLTTRRIREESAMILRAVARLKEALKAEERRHAETEGPDLVNPCG
jgi:hypothetical protein